MVVTLKDISEKTGVSPTVVSHVLNDRIGHIRVSESKRRFIKKVADELGYVPNLKAKSMITRKSYTIGLICSYIPRNTDLYDRTDYYVGNALRGVERACREVNYHCLVSYCDLSSLEKFVYPRAVKDSSVDGVVLIGYTSSSVVKKLSAMNIPCVQIGSNIEDDSNNIDCVYADLDDGFAQAVRYLAELGHRRVQLYLPAGPGPEFHAKNFRQLNKRINGVETEAVLSSSVESHIVYARDYARELVKRRDIPTAFIANAIDGRGISEGLAEAGLECPRDYSLICFSADFADRNIVSKAVKSPFTLIHWDGAQAGYLATRKLLARLGVIELEPDEKERKTVPCRIIYGASCGKYKKLI